MIHFELLYKREVENINETLDKTLVNLQKLKKVGTDNISNRNLVNDLKGGIETIIHNLNKLL
jgi:hypothetical protein